MLELRPRVEAEVEEEKEEEEDEEEEDEVGEVSSWGTGDVPG